MTTVSKPIAMIAKQTNWRHAAIILHDLVTYCQYRWATAETSCAAASADVRWSPSGCMLYQSENVQQPTYTSHKLLLLLYCCCGGSVALSSWVMQAVCQLLPSPPPCITAPVPASASRYLYDVSIQQFIFINTVINRILVKREIHSIFGTNILVMSNGINM